MKIAISAESTIDLPKELLAKYDIQVVPFTVTLGDVTALDGEITPKEIYDFVEKTGKLPRTSAVNEYQFDEHFKGILKDYDAIIHFSLSSSLSSAYENALRASKGLNNVLVIDTKSLSTGIALLAIYGRSLADKGEELHKIFEKCSKRVPFVQASFVLNNLEYLYKGGRCSSLQRFGVNLLKIRPQILVTNGGMISGKMYRGKDAVVVKKYCDDTLALFNNPDKTIAFVTATDYTEDIFQIAENALKEQGFKTIYRTTAGATITSHCGKKTIGILYLNDGEQE
ncbi:MAG: DegV family EDD domain-containing protein [Erysipelotrichaceae bacterium]|nr:DegV family EDD domain-containing protein [Erysipelotrichaceae bacterium]